MLKKSRLQNCNSKCSLRIVNIEIWWVKNTQGILYFFFRALKNAQAKLKSQQQQAQKEEV